MRVMLFHFSNNLQLLNTYMHSSTTCLYTKPYQPQGMTPRTSRVLLQPFYIHSSFLSLISLQIPSLTNKGRLYLQSQTIRCLSFANVFPRKKRPPLPTMICHLHACYVFRNLLIVLTSPIQFSVYCSMSEQFRLTAKQLFSTKLLFVAQAQATFHGGKRYSLVLVNVDLIERKRSTVISRPSSVKSR